MDTDILRLWSESIFKSLQPVQDGGIITSLTQAGLQNFTISDTLLWGRDLLLRPYYNLTIVLGAIWSLIIPLILFLLLLRYCRSNYLCCYKCVRQLQRGVNAVGRRCLDRKQLVSELPNRSVTCRNEEKKFRDTCAKIICCVVCLIGLCAGLYYTIFESDQVQYFLNEDENSTQSYKTYKDAGLLEFKGFLENGVQSANISTAEWVKDFEVKLNQQMTLFVRNLSNELFIRFGVFFTLDKSETVVNRLTAVFRAMEYINNNRQKTVQQASNFAGRVNTVKDIMKSYIKCDKLEHPHECYAVSDDINKLEMNIDWSSIDFDTSTSIINLVNQQNLNMFVLKNEVHNSRVMLRFYVGNFERDALKMVSEANILNEISKVWNTADAMLKKSVISLLDDLITDEPEQKYMSQASSIWRMVSYLGWGICLTFAIIAFITGIFALSKLCFKLYAAKRQSRRDKYVSRLESLFANKKTSAIDADAEKMKQVSDETLEEDSGSLCIYRTLCFMHSTLGILLFVPCVITLVAFLSSGVLTTEVCRYLVDEKGVEVADRQIDLFIGRIWDDSIDGLNLSSFLELKCPSHVLRGIYQTCRKPNMSMIESFGMTGTFNATKFIKSPSFSKVMDVGYSVVKKNFDGLNTNEMIPVNVIKYIDDGVEFIQKFVDGKNYTDSVNELNKPIFKLTDFPSFIHRLERLSQSFPNLRQRGDIFQKLIPLYSSLEKEIAEFRTKFETLAKYSNLSEELRDLKMVLQNTVSNIKNKTLKATTLPLAYHVALKGLVGDLSDSLETDISALERRLFPCQQLHKAYSIFMRAICGDLRNGLGSFALSLAMTVIWLQFCFLFSWCLVSMLNPPFTPKDCTNC